MQEAMASACEELVRLFVEYLVGIVKVQIPTSAKDPNFLEKARGIAQVPRRRGWTF
jgi:hypothetical protein